MKNNKKALIVLSIILLLTIILTSYILYNKSQIELVQLSPQTDSQMMGYIIKTSNKLIIIDGGTIR